MVGDDGAFRGEALRVFCFLLKIAQWDQQREVGVHMACLLKFHIKLALDVLPEAVTPRFDDHAAAHLGVLRHVGGADHLLIPLGKIFVAAGLDGGGRLAHGRGNWGKLTVWGFRIWSIEVFDC